MYNEAILILEKDKKLTSSENDFIAQLNRALNVLSDKQSYEKFRDKLINEGNYVFIDRNYFGDFREILYDFTKINFAYDNANLITFDGNISVYPINKINEINLMDINLFVQFVKEQKISTIFVSNCVDNNIIKPILKTDVQEFYDMHLGFRKEFYEFYEKIIVPQIDIFNNILAKTTTKSTSSQIYMCNFNGIQITAKINSTNSLNTESLLKLIYFNNVEEFINTRKQVQKIIEANEKIEQNEYERRKAEKLIQLEELIKNDPEFMKVTQARMRERYLKDILRNEDDEVISYFNMKRRYDGSLASSSLTGQQFINKIWDDLNKK